MAFISFDDQGNLSIKSINCKSKEGLSSRMMAERTSKTNLYIKGLPSHFNDDMLTQMVPFQDKIRSIKTAIDNNGRCKGYGFVDFISEEAAKDALTFLEKKYPNNSVKLAKENEKDRTNLYVTNLPKDWTNDDSEKLKNIFQKYGSIQSAFVMLDRSTKKTSGVGFVRFSYEHEALRAIESLHDDKVVLSSCDRPIEAKFADKHSSETRKRRITPVTSRSNHCSKNAHCHNSQYPEGVLPLEINPSISLQNSLLLALGNNSMVNYPPLVPVNFMTFCGATQSSLLDGIGFPLLPNDSRITSLQFIQSHKEHQYTNDHAITTNCTYPSYHLGK